MNTCVRQPFLQLFMGNIYICGLKYIMCTSQMCITPTVVGVYRDWPGSSALNLYI